MVEKPPPQIAGVSGIGAVPITMNDHQERIDWRAIELLPPFGMFLAELHSGVFPGPSPALYAAYCAWHEEKGYWPNETPMGKLKGGE